jgi:archaeosine synthase beta-subunit
VKASLYPEKRRSEWILEKRPPRTHIPDPERPHGIFLEEERLGSGEVVSSGVVLLTNRECPWRCLMCDLWKETTLKSVPPGAVARQVGIAISEWRGAGGLPRQVKLYNSGSFFDPAAIAPGDRAAIAQMVGFAENVVVESHPLLIGDRAVELRDQLAGSLEVAMGLETAHPDVLERLNKKFDLGMFARAGEFLQKEGIAMRAFILVNPPFLGAEDGIGWAVESAEFAFSCGAGAVSLIPTRVGNGAMEALLASGEFIQPTLASLEAALRECLSLGRGRVFADTWGIEAFSTCPRCAAARIERIGAVNLGQRDLPPVACPECGGA